MAPLFNFDPVARILLFGSLAVSAGCTPEQGPRARDTPQDATPPSAVAGATRPQHDLSGRTRFGNASFYAQRFAGRTMADGAKMDPLGDNAASKTLPLGTRATVTNMDTGQSAVVTIQDRGPYVKGRIVDLSPSTASKIGLTPAQGVARVKVAPISVPLPDGGTRPGVATPDSKARASP